MNKKFKVLLSVAMIAISGCAGSQLSSKESFSFSALKYLANANNIVSDKQSAEYKHFDIYYSSGNATLSSDKFIESINKCINYGTASINEAGQGYKVLKSFGYSDEKILLDGTRSCMEAKDWQLYTLKKDQLERIADNKISYSTMSEKEQSIQKEFLSRKFEWYKKYAPEVLDR